MSSDTFEHETETVADTVDSVTVADTGKALTVPDALARDTNPAVASGPGRTGSTIHATTLAALHGDEAARANGFARVIAVVSAASLIGLPFQDVPLWLTLLFASTMAGVALLSLWVWQRTRTAATYTPTVFRVFATGCLFTGLVAVYYGGVFSSVPVIIALGLSFFAFGDDRRFAIGFSLAAVAIYALMAALTIVGILPEYGLFTAGHVGTMAKLFAILITSTALVTTVWQARMSRSATYNAVEKLNLALLEIQERDALLAEANQNLDQALEADAGKRGRYTGTRAGSYALGDLVGRGAMGEVYGASHVETGDRAAVKVLSEAGRNHPGYLERFRREAKIAATLNAANVVRVFEVGEVDSVSPFIAMELLDGHDLGWHLRRRRKLPLAELTDVLEQISRGVQAAHDAGIIHRDLKPSNLFLDEAAIGGRPIWKVLDFGVSKIAGSGQTLTQGAVVGTPGYMSPEQAQGKTPTLASDVFSLGAVAYRALTGRPPFTGPDTPQVLYTLVYHQPDRPSRWANLGSEAHDIDAVLALALAKQPSERLQSAKAFSAAWASAARDELSDELRDRAAAILQRNGWGRDSAR